MVTGLYPITLLIDGNDRRLSQDNALLINVNKGIRGAQINTDTSVLEQCGLAQHTDFIMEHSVATEDGRLRPDAIVRRSRSPSSRRSAAMPSPG